MYMCANQLEEYLKSKEQAPIFYSYVSRYGSCATLVDKS